MRNYTEQEMREILGQEMQVSEQVEERLSDTYRQIRTQKRKSRFHVWQGAAGTVAAFFAAGVFCVSNPVLAAKLPFIGHIFEELGDEASYAGDYSGVGTQLAEGGENAETGASAAAETAGKENGAQEVAGNYSQTANGMTVTLSEVYCNDVALYLTMELKGEEPIADHFELYDGKPVLQAQGTAKFSFMDEDCSFQEVLDGKFVDDYTYLAMYRMELDPVCTDYSEFHAALQEAYGEEGPSNDGETAQYRDLIKKRDLPESFDVSLSFDRIFGDRKDPMSIYDAAKVEKPSEEELNAMSDEEWNSHMMELFELVPDYNNTPNPYEDYTYEGPYTFDFTVQVDHEQTVTVEVENDAAGKPFVSSVTKTPFELYLEEQGLEEAIDLDPVLVVLDANGKRIETGKRGGSLNMLAIDGHDVSKIDIYYITWEDFEGKQIKGSYFDEHDTNESGETLKDVLDACNMYHKEVTFG